MPEEVSPTHPRTKPHNPGDRRTPVWLLIGVVALASAGISWAAIGMTAHPVAKTGSAGSTGSPAVGTPGSTPKSTPSPEPLASGEPTALSPQSAENVITGFLGALEHAASDPAKAGKALDNFAAGPILAELQNEQEELVVNGWSRTGSDTVASLSVVSTDTAADPPTATVQACIDSSAVIILDAAGKPIVSGTPADQKRATNIYTLTRSGENWVVTARTFPNDAGC